MDEVPLSKSLDIERTFAVERDSDGKIVHAIGHKQEIGPIMDRVRQISEDSPFRAANFKFVGSIPMTMVLDYCTRNHIDFGTWARNENGHQKKFLKEFLTSEYSQLLGVSPAEARGELIRG